MNTLEIVKQRVCAKHSMKELCEAMYELINEPDNENNLQAVLAHAGQVKEYMEELIEAGQGIEEEEKDEEDDYVEPMVIPMKSRLQPLSK